MDGDEKAKLYKQIVDATDDWTLLERMRELGLWPEDEPLPEPPLEEIREAQVLTDEVEGLRRKGTRIADPDKALALERVRRWKESKKRRFAAKAAREADKKARREAWDAHIATTIVHAGEGVSAGLQPTTPNHERLDTQGLAHIDTPTALADWLGLSLGRLRWLTFHRRGAAIVHYRRYEVPKKTGGIRHISAPKPTLAKAQRHILEHLLAKLPVSEVAHGFVPGRSIASNATPHVGAAVVVNLDIQNFFPTVTFPRVKGVFRHLGYDDAVATLLALLTTEPPRVAATVDDETLYLAVGERALPQGACTSPALTNLVCRRIDRRLSGACRHFGYRYTRYADDFTFSTDDPGELGRFLGFVRRILRDEGFTEHPTKTRVMRRGRRQEVTGLTVNVKANVPRSVRRRLRAILHNAKTHGLASQNRDDHPRFREHVAGYVAYLSMIEPDRAGQWQAALAAALAGPG